jgi:hypothetical protein
VELVEIIHNLFTHGHGQNTFYDILGTGMEVNLTERFFSAKQLKAITRYFIYIYLGKRIEKGFPLQFWRILLRTFYK